MWWRGLSRLGSTATCEKTIIKLENVKGAFQVSDYADRGAYIDGINIF